MKLTMAQQKEIEGAKAIAKAPWAYASTDISSALLALVKLLEGPKRAK